MMETIRHATQTWLAAVVVFLLVISFAIWGVKDVFNTSRQEPVATVGDQDIDQGTFQQAYNLAFRQAQSQQGENFTQADALAANLDRQTLDGLIRRVTVGQIADRMHITTSDQMLRQQIVTNPAFAGPTGQFEQRTYQEALASAGMTPPFFEREMRADITRSQLVGSVVSGYYMPRGLATAHYEYAFEQRQVTYFILPPAAAGNIPDPDEATLQAFYDSHTNNYRAPEYRALTVLKLAISDLAAQMDVSEEDIQQLYNVRQAQLQVPERRHIEQLTFENAGDAQAAMALLDAGGDFQSVGGTYVDLGDLAQNEGIDSAVMNAAFGLDEPGIAGIVEGLLSTSIVRVTSITPGQTTPLEAVHDDLRQELAEQAAGEEIFAISEHVQDAIAGGEDLATIGDQFNIPVITTAAVDRTGHAPDGTEVTDLTGTPGLVDAAFELAEGENSGFRDTQDGDFYVARLDGITPARIKSFDEVRDQVLDGWRGQQITETLATTATDAAARINAGERLADVAVSLGLDVRNTPRALRRSTSSEIFSTALLNTLFTNAAGTAASGPVQLGSSYVVAEVTQVIPADPEADADQVSALKTALENRIASELVDAYVNDAEAALDVRINEQVLSQVVSSLR